MINVFNSPIEAATLDEFHEGPAREGEQKVFTNTRKRPVVSYRSDGRKTVDGQVTEERPANVLWTKAINNGVANEWREKAEGSRLYKVKRYVANLCYDCRVMANTYSRKHFTYLLIILNVSLVLIALHIFKLIVW
ncbi:unnamed protein product [Auanema sp. JU1783]|nr:unnamed protein product [Auanema sp. JU1783]